eukprot:CAMPEP_0179003698 /NCGR_PEP_ID=MMETSP0795-20121207/12853_1 /TAXON_ID=88552 /ORGANISM="Amoebophrya sp., Strain Ameob2" /LENGTH=133 /DNA_ID=CAMNT_0020697797 /DNA_START=187 /DNA_END=585 /DNA_ORIENTATION=+
MQLLSKLVLALAHGVTHREALHLMKDAGAANKNAIAAVELQLGHRADVEVDVEDVAIAEAEKDADFPRSSALEKMAMQPPKAKAKGKAVAKPKAKGKAAPKPKAKGKAVAKPKAKGKAASKSKAKGKAASKSK